MYHKPNYLYYISDIDSFIILHAVIMVPCIFLQPFSSAYSFVSCYCLWRQISLPKTKLGLSEKKKKKRRIRQKPQKDQKNLHHRTYLATFLHPRYHVLHSQGCYLVACDTLKLCRKKRVNMV